jgi:hypothetical protein
MSSAVEKGSRYVGGVGGGAGAGFAAGSIVVGVGFGFGKLIVAFGGVFFFATGQSSRVSIIPYSIG